MLVISALQLAVSVLRVVRSVRVRVRGALLSWAVSLVDWLTPDVQIAYYDPWDYYDLLFVLVGFGLLCLAAAFCCGFLTARWIVGRAPGPLHGGATRSVGMHSRPRVASPVPLPRRPQQTSVRRLQRSLTDAPSPARNLQAGLRSEFPVGLLGNTSRKAAPSANGDFRPL